MNSRSATVVVLSLSLVLSACSGEKTAVAKKPQPSPETSQPPLPLPAGVTLKQLSHAPVPIPAPYQTLETYELTAKEEAFGEGEIEVRIPKSHVNGSDEYLTELYRYENGEYIKEQIEGEPNQFHFYVGRYWTEEGKPTGDYKATYVIARAKRAELEKGFKETGGFFNGIYGECSEGTMSSFGKCVAIPSDKKITGQALPAGGEGIKFVSLNAGNASSYCYKLSLGYLSDPSSDYKAKMCSFTTEERTRNQIVNKIKPDLAVIQEVWNGQCTSEHLGEESGDKVCGIGENDTRLRNSYQEQIKRLFTPDLYDTSCALLSAGGYECIALRKGVFQFEESSPEVATGVATQIANTPNYCDEDSAKGKDTGFYGRTVSLVNPKGSHPMPFDLWNAHLASPAGGNDNCRAQQIAALAKAYKNTYRKLLIAGDFNTNYYFPIGRHNRDTTMLRSIATPFGTEVDSLENGRLTYMVSNQNDWTAFSTPLPRSYDHVMSNFADVSSGDKCNRIFVWGLDHLTTSCVLQGFDTGSVRTALLATDTGSKPTEIIPSSLSVFRKGAEMNWVRQEHYSGSTIHRVYLPSNIESIIKLKAICINNLSFEVKKVVKIETAKEVRNIIEAVVQRDLCP